ncbi:UNVERIFIED_ORG: hypothetical protein ABRZ91_001790 [Heyndrickxia coagulans]
MKMGKIDNFKYLSQFISLKDFNNSIEMWMAEYKSTFTKGELAALKRLIRYSAKVYGVSTASIRTLSTAANVSEATFQRMKRKAIKMGMLTVHYTERNNGSQSSNVWVFNRFNDTPNKLPKQQEKPSQQAAEGAEGDDTATSPKSGKNLKTGNQNNKRLDGSEAEFVSNRIPTTFKHLASCFYHKAATIEELWKVVKCATKKLNYTLAETSEIACDGFKQLIRLVKRGKVRKSPYAAFWGILNNMLDERYFNELHALEQEIGVNSAYVEELEFNFKQF